MPLRVHTFGILVAAFAGIAGCSMPPARAASKHLPADPFTGARAGQGRNIQGVRFCWCPPGRFTMGSPPDEMERRPDESQVEVTLTHGFWIAEYEATQRQWKQMYANLPGPLTAEL